MSKVSSPGLSAANNDFTKDVYRHLAANTPHNAVISPLSLHMVLGLSSFGAAGSTADAMMKGLRIKHAETLRKDYKDSIDLLSKSAELRMVNTIYFAQHVQLNPDYQSQAVDHFNSELRKTDFTKPEAAAKQMNDWVSRHTNDIFKDLIQSESLTPDTKIVLMNAIHFKGKWTKQFLTANTKDGPFYLDETNNVQLPLMHMTRKFSIYQETGDDGFQVLELPYGTWEGKQQFSMHIFLPNKRTGLATLEQKLFQSEESFAEKFGNIAKGARRCKVVVTLPRFKIESTWDMNNLCKQLGMGVAFTDEADFSLMTQDKMLLAISQVVQKAFIEVNEEGTEATAATAIKIVPMCLRIGPPPPPIYFTADHPFIVTIIRKSNSGTKISNERYSFQRKVDEKFLTANTKDGPFYLDETNNVQVLELPYGSKEGQQFSMHIFLPNKRTGLATLEQKLFQSEESFAEKFGNITKGARMCKVVVTLPRFKIESTWDMKNPCKQLGRAWLSLIKQTSLL
ncbi:hypothetical protein WDU94_007735 [Cyamophila willieti]